MGTDKKKIGGKQGPRAGMKDKGGKKRIIKKKATVDVGGHKTKIKVKTNTKTGVTKVKTTSKTSPIKKSVIKGTPKAIRTYKKTGKATPGLKRNVLKRRK